MRFGELRSAQPVAAAVRHEQQLARAREQRRGACVQPLVGAFAQEKRLARPHDPQVARVVRRREREQRFVRAQELLRFGEPQRLLEPRELLHDGEGFGERGGVALRALEIIQRELDVTMALCGLRSVREANRSVLRG